MESIGTLGQTTRMLKVEIRKMFKKGLRKKLHDGAND